MPFKDPEKLSEYMRKYYLAHREALLTKKRAEYEADPEKYRERLRACRSANPDMVKKSNESRVFVCGMYLGRG